jgi:carbonic anhydrase
MSKKTYALFTVFCMAVFAVVSVVVTQGQKTNGRKKAGDGDKKAVTNLAVTQTKESQRAMTPDRALQLLKDGNRRFVSGAMVNRDLRAQIAATSGGQFPFATILSCQDSRASSDLLFDLNKGDAFSLRIAGNVVNEDILGGMEFGSKAAGAKLIAVIGHTKCGAIYGACDDVKMGNLTGLLDKIRPAVSLVPDSIKPRDSKNPVFVEAVTKENVRHQMRQIKEKSPLLKEMIDKGEVGLVGGLYDISTGKVEFFEN